MSEPLSLSSFLFGVPVLIVLPWYDVNLIQKNSVKFRRIHSSAKQHPIHKNPKLRLFFIIVKGPQGL